MRSSRQKPVAGHRLKATAIDDRRTNDHDAESCQRVHQEVDRDEEKNEHQADGHDAGGSDHMRAALFMALAAYPPEPKREEPERMQHDLTTKCARAGLVVTQVGGVVRRSPLLSR